MQETQEVVHASSGFLHAFGLVKMLVQVHYEFRQREQKRGVFLPQLQRAKHAAPGIPRLTLFAPQLLERVSRRQLRDYISIQFACPLNNLRALLVRELARRIFFEQGALVRAADGGASCGINQTTMVLTEWTGLQKIMTTTKCLDCQAERAHALDFVRLD